MPKKHPTEVRDRAVRLALEKLPDYPSAWAAYRDLGPKLTRAALSFDNSFQPSRIDKREAGVGTLAGA